MYEPRAKTFWRDHLCALKVLLRLSAPVSRPLRARSRTDYWDYDIDDCMDQHLTWIQHKILSGKLWKITDVIKHMSSLYCIKIVHLYSASCCLTAATNKRRFQCEGQLPWGNEIGNLDKRLIGRGVSKERD